MENLGGGMLFIIVVALTVINLVLYHKIFHVLYFDLGKGLLKEIIGAWFVAVIEIGLVGALLRPILSGAIKIVAVIIKCILIIVVIVAVLLALWFLYKKIIRKEDVGEFGDEQDKNKGEVILQDVDEDTAVKGNSEQSNMQEMDYSTPEGQDNQEEKESILQTKDDSEDVVFCAKCGNKISKKYKFCIYCGNRM